MRAAQEGGGREICAGVKVAGGRAFMCGVGIAALVLLMAGGAGGSVEVNFGVRK